jgi:hypothetical protein
MSEGNWSDSSCVTDYQGPCTRSFDEFPIEHVDAWTSTQKPPKPVSIDATKR